MRVVATLALICGLTMISTIPLDAQQEGDFRTRSSGNWNDAIWQVFSGGNWVNTGNHPSGSETITVREDDSVFVNVDVTITGKLVNQGRVAVDDQKLTIGDGGVYQHDRDAGNMPIVNWADGSTLLLTGTTGTAPADRNQNYYNIIFDTPDLMANLNMDLNGVTIGGDIIVRNTGLGRWYLTTALSQDTSIVTIMGDVVVEAGHFSVQGTSNAFTTFVVHHYGNITVTGGNFSISRGSQPGGTTKWYLYEGDFSMSNAMTQNSNAIPGNATFIFAREGTQRLTVSNLSFADARGLPVEVSPGTTLDMGESTLEVSWWFQVPENAGIFTAHANGVAGNFGAGAVSAVVLANGSSYGFNGTAPQVTSTLMPTVVTDLVIDNPEGVVLSQQTTINGVLRLLRGVFDNTIPFELGPNGSISEEGGSLLHPFTSVKEIAGDIPRSFFVDQNYPNPFNPTTIIRFGLPTASNVTVKLYNMLGQEVKTVLEADLSAGIYAVPVDGSNLSSGVYLYRVRAGDQITTKRMMLVK